MKGPGPIRVVVVLATFIIFAFAVILWQPVWMFHWNDYKVGNQIIARVEAFKKDRGRLPDKLEDLGINDDSGVSYCKVSDDEYIVWFGTTLGESETFSSQSRHWGSGGAACKGPPLLEP